MTQSTDSSLDPFNSSLVWLAWGALYWATKWLVMWLPWVQTLYDWSKVGWLSLGAKGEEEGGGGGGGWGTINSPPGYLV
jgi:hypothetical protein